MRSTSLEPLVVAALCAALPAFAAAAPPAGEYRVAATVRVHAGGVLDREVREDARAVLAPASAGRVRVKLSARGKTCELSARAGEQGELTFAPGQRCALALDEEDVRGRVEATLGSGTGRAQGDALTLALDWQLVGTVSLRMGGERIEVMGSEIAVPAGWAPEVPVRGTADARAQGRRSGAR
ncbi:hypothetical protein [Anaeromyxobacter terrae]|uniref:hypothetical protein n=1 Tax=Anaeromyxobacter terrae TaxID=2925406 RepID=UPI001F593F1D|nr:hypothetical protein [Anaeromyxobacter sp. SG22]